MSKCIKTVSPAAIKTDGLQVRVETCQAHIDDIAAIFDEGNPTWPAELPPVVVFLDGKKYWLADGHHRLAAAIAAGCQEIRVTVQTGTKRDAQLYACGANADHGLKRSPADRRNAVLTALSLAPGTPRRNIARLCRVSEALVRYYLEQEESAKKPTEAASAAQIAQPGAIKEARPGDAQFAQLKLSEPAASGAQFAHPEADAESEPAPPQHAAPPVDGAKREPFAECLGHFGHLESVIRQAQRIAGEIAGMRGGELYRTHHLQTKQTTRGGESVTAHQSPDLANALSELAHWKPHAECPHCAPLGAPQHDCGICRGLGWVTASQWDRVPEKLRNGQGE